jgi:hypothetical protein
VIQSRLGTAGTAIVRRVMNWTDLIDGGRLVALIPIRIVDMPEHKQSLYQVELRGPIVHDLLRPTVGG